MKIFYFLIEVSPAPKSSNFSEAGGAFVSCWVKGSSEGSAVKKAQAAIRNDGWDIVTVDDTFIAERERYIDLPESLELFEQAEVDGEAYVFDTWPPEPQEDDSVH
ncbi:MAG: hypothetical protein KJ804_14150 [Proteobacteria bacterium]|nr:hypothetical protein [Pseudomonadota bacterium]MBU1059451.1 hypothetical protein [Pseudomonadota bacterium]